MEMQHKFIAKIVLAAKSVFNISLPIVEPILLLVVLSIYICMGLGKSDFNCFKPLRALLINWKSLESVLRL